MTIKTLGSTALVTLAALVLPAAAQADYPHVVTRGETLTSIAATDGLSVDALAAANGLSPYTELEVGQIVEIPPQTAATEATDTAQTTGATDTSEATGTTDTAAAPSGSYVVQPGDTLTAIAARDDTSVAALAALNGLNPNGYLIIGTALQLPAPGAAGETGTTNDQTATTEEVSDTTSDTSSDSDTGGPYPTDQYVSGSEVGDIAAANGVSAPLAEAVGWQESGYDNDLVSDTGAVGVMQIEPSTWSWIQDNLAGDSLEPASATSNVQGGVLLLGDLLRITGSDSMAAAGYYQGLQSIKEHGLYPSTQQYVDDVMALDERFGG